MIWIESSYVQSDRLRSDDQKEPADIDEAGLIGPESGSMESEEHMR